MDQKRILQKIKAFPLDWGARGFRGLMAGRSKAECAEEKAGIPEIGDSSRMFCR